MSLITDLREYLNNPVFFGVDLTTQTVKSMSDVIKTEADAKKVNDFLQKWNEYDGFEKGSHELYLFLLGNNIDTIDHITLRRLDKDPEGRNPFIKGIPQLLEFFGQ